MAFSHAAVQNTSHAGTIVGGSHHRVGNMNTNKNIVSSRHTRAVIFSVAAALGLALATGCTSTSATKLSPKEEAALQGGSVALHQLPTAHFRVNASSAVVVAALDPFKAGEINVEAGEAGVRLAKQDRLIDPATVIGPGLLADLQSQHHMEIVAGAPPAAAAKYALSVEVTVWNVMYLLFRPGHYGIMLVVNADITDSKTKKKLRGAQCIIRPRDQPDAPTLQELLENDGPRLRTEVDYASGA